MVSSLFEDFREGEKFATRIRTVTPTDIDLFATMSGAVNPLFLSEAFASQLGYRTRVTPGLLTLALMVGTIYQTGVFDNVLALTGIDKLRFKKPVYPGDSLKSEVEVVGRKESDKPDRGLVTLRSDCLNQKGETVLEAELSLIVKRKP